MYSNRKIEFFQILSSTKQYLKSFINLFIQMDFIYYD